MAAGARGTRGRATTLGALMMKLRHGEVSLSDDFVTKNPLGESQ